MISIQDASDSASIPGEDDSEVMVMKMERGWFMVVWCLVVMQGGCIFFETNPDVETCETSVLCAGDAPEVCGEDGERYACAELAACEDVGIDDTGGACGEDVCKERTIVSCNTFCANGYAQDEDGCQTCECYVPAVCPRRPNCSGGKDPDVSGYDEEGCPKYVCPVN